MLPLDIIHGIKGQLRDGALSFIGESHAEITPQAVAIINSRWPNEVSALHIAQAINSATEYCNAFPDAQELDREVNQLHGQGPTPEEIENEESLIDVEPMD